MCRPCLFPTLRLPGRSLTGDIGQAEDKYSIGYAIEVLNEIGLDILVGTIGLKMNFPHSHIHTIEMAC